VLKFKDMVNGKNYKYGLRINLKAEGENYCFRINSSVSSKAILKEKIDV